MCLYVICFSGDESQQNQTPKNRDLAFVHHFAQFSKHVSGLHMCHEKSFFGTYKLNIASLQVVYL